MQLEELMKKIEEKRRNGSFDLGKNEDLSIAVMNLISLEEHFFFTAEKTGKDEYFDLLKDVREMRKELLAKMVAKHEGETWCVSKHLLAASMRLMEVGTKLQSSDPPAGGREKAKEVFDYAYKLYTIFWGLRLKLLELPDIKKMAKEDKAAWSLQDIVNKLVNCCDE